MNWQPEKIVGQYRLGLTIGSGTFGSVKCGIHTGTGAKVAVKSLEKGRISDLSDVERVSREIHILKQLGHPHIVRLYEIVETAKHFHLILEYASGGELFHYVVKKRRLKEQEACTFLHQLMIGLEYMHSLNITHRDLKPENLLLDEHKNIKIADFGLSSRFDHGSFLRTACGSPCYAAPEMVRGEPYFGPQIDVWSAGVVLYAMLCGSLPFEDPNTARLYMKITRGVLDFPSYLSEMAKSLICGMLHLDPSVRMNIDNVKQSTWVQSWLGGVITSGDIKSHTCGLSACRPCQTWVTPNGVFNQEVLEELPQHRISQEYAIKCLKQNKHNNATATYYLILDMKAKRLRTKPFVHRPSSAPTPLLPEVSVQLIEEDVQWSTHDVSTHRVPISTPEVGECPSYSLATPLLELPQSYRPAEQSTQPVSQAVCHDMRRSNVPALTVRPIPFMRRIERQPVEAVSQRPLSGFSRRSVPSPTIEAITNSLCRPTASTFAKQREAKRPDMTSHGVNTSRFTGRRADITNTSRTPAGKRTPLRPITIAGGVRTAERSTDFGRPIRHGNESVLSSKYMMTTRSRPLPTIYQARPKSSVR